ncbi:MAG: putative transporter [Chthonomonas sp.]
MNAERLRRELGLVGAVAVGLGAIVGAGLFVVVGVGAGIAGPALLAGLALAAVVASFNALSSAQLAARFPTSGGAYEFGYALIHPWAGFAAGWLFVLSKVSAGGTVALGLGAYVNTVWPSVPSAAVAVGAVIALTGANLLGIKKAGWLNLVIVSITLLSLVAFVLSGLGRVELARFEPFAPRGPASILEVSALMFFAYTGYARLATLAEEVRDPERTIPRAMLISLASASALYLLVCAVSIGVVGADGLAASRAPLSTAAERLGTPIAVAIGVAAGTAMLGVLLSQILGISRVLLAMARRGDLPGGLAQVDARHGVPVAAVLTTGGLILLVTLVGRIEWVASTAAFTILLYYAVANSASLRLPREALMFPRWVSWAGLATCLLFAASIRPAVAGAGLGLLAIGFAVRAVVRAFTRRSEPF